MRPSRRPCRALLSNRLLAATPKRKRSRVTFFTCRFEHARQSCQAPVISCRHAHTIPSLSKPPPQRPQHRCDADPQGNCAPLACPAVDWATMVPHAASFSPTDPVPVGQHVLVRCIQGYRVGGVECSPTTCPPNSPRELSVVCRQGTGTTCGYSNPGAECKPVACPMFLPPANATAHEVSGNEFTSTAHYECDKGYRIDGPTMPDGECLTSYHAECMEDGTWDRPECIPVVCETPIVFAYTHIDVMSPVKNATLGTPSSRGAHTHCSVPAHAVQDHVFGHVFSVVPVRTIHPLTSCHPLGSNKVPPPQHYPMNVPFGHTLNVTCFHGYHSFPVPVCEGNCLLSHEPRCDSNTCSAEVLFPPDFPARFSRQFRPLLAARCGVLFLRHAPVPVVGPITHSHSPNGVHLLADRA